MARCWAERDILERAGEVATQKRKMSCEKCKSKERRKFTDSAQNDESPRFGTTSAPEKELGAYRMTGAIWIG